MRPDTSDLTARDSFSPAALLGAMVKMDDFTPNSPNIDRSEFNIVHPPNSDTEIPKRVMALYGDAFALLDISSIVLSIVYYD
jgi:hypothetical protein